MTNETKPDSKSAVARFTPLLLIAGALALFFALGLQRFFSLDVLRENREVLIAWRDGNPALALAVFVVAYAGAVAISFPGASILTIFGGFLFGLIPGAPAVVTAATLGSFLVYLAARSALGDGLSKRASGFIKRMEQGFRENELSYMLLLRLVPLFPFWAVNIAAGAAGVKTHNYLMGTFIGIIPGSFVYAGLGATAGDAFDAGETLSLSGLLLRPQTLVILGVFIALAMAPILYKALTKSVKAAEGAN